DPASAHDLGGALRGVRELRAVVEAEVGEHGADPARVGVDEHGGEDLRRAGELGQEGAAVAAVRAGERDALGRPVTVGMWKEHRRPSLSESVDGLANDDRESSFVNYRTIDSH